MKKRLRKKVEKSLHDTARMRKAIERSRVVYPIINKMAELLKCKPEEVSDKTEQLFNALKLKRQEVKRLRDRLNS